MRQKLMTKKLAGKLPSFYSTEKIPMAEKIVWGHYFSPWMGWDWYLLEYDSRPDERLLFALVCGFEVECGYVSLDELETTTRKIEVIERNSGHVQVIEVPAVERDKFFEPCKLSEIGERNQAVAEYLAKCRKS